MWSQNYRKVVPCQILWRWLTSVGKDLPSIRWAQDGPHLSHVLTTGQRRTRTTCLTFQGRVQESTFSTFFAQRFVSSLFLLHFWHPRVSRKRCSETLSLSVLVLLWTCLLFLLSFSKKCLTRMILMCFCYCLSVFVPLFLFRVITTVGKRGDILKRSKGIGQSGGGMKRMFEKEISGESRGVM